MFDLIVDQILEEGDAEGQVREKERHEPALDREDDDASAEISEESKVVLMNRRSSMEKDEPMSIRTRWWMERRRRYLIDSIQRSRWMKQVIRA